MKEKYCPDYLCSTCVDGGCPMVLAREYPEYYDDPVRNCGECPFYKGCEDCSNSFCDVNYS